MVSSINRASSSAESYKLENVKSNHQEDLSTSAARETAYSSGQADEYDSFRFVKKSGKAIHVAERGCLTRALEKVRPPAHILEVGCGTGRLLIEMEQLGYTVDGADASVAMLEKTKEKFVDSSRQPELMLCGASEIPASDNTYDFTYSIRLLNQTESPEYALTVVTEILRVTKPNGYCLIEFMNENRPRLGMNKRACTRLRPVDVLKTATQSGAEIVHWDGAFLLSMQAYHAVPEFLLGVVKTADRLCSALLPRLCSRTYLMVRKKAA